MICNTSLSFFTKIVFTSWFKILLILIHANTEPSKGYTSIERKMIYKKKYKVHVYNLYSIIMLIRQQLIRVIFRLSRDENH